ncbi:Hypothetical protein PMT_2720 [Prochlorococcus marinus str. MIT 9313]|uniref:Uncharacterized protein n=1 Tax=Prochlorococcus marinus (strain MIT 9313) TaxID=74547 RepID=B9ESA3_PROMM|nr:Hypothetical protein PMT_2720 [Prochlorococcus marinus str. MIT 9313]
MLLVMLVTAFNSNYHNKVYADQAWLLSKLSIKKHRSVIYLSRMSSFGAHVLPCLFFKLLQGFPQASF